MSSHIPEGSVIITPGEIYGEVKELTREVRDLITADKAEQRDRARIEAMVVEQGKRLDRHETEISSIKQKLWFIAGIASAAGGGLGSLVAPLLIK